MVKGFSYIQSKFSHKHLMLFNKLCLTWQQCRGSKKLCALEHNFLVLKWLLKCLMIWVVLDDFCAVLITKSQIL